MLRRAAETTRGRLTLLAATIAIVVLGTAALGHFAFDEYASFGAAFWSAILHLLDPSSLHDDEGTAQRAIGTVQVVAGLVLLVGVLFTVIAEVMSSSLQRLGQTDRPVHARDHLLIIGGSGLVSVAARSAAETPRQTSELERIVVLAPESARESRAQLRSELEDAVGGLRFDLVFGDTAGDSGFELAAAREARTILLMSSATDPIGAEAADVEVTQSGLALLDHLREADASPAVRLLFRRGRNVDAAWELFPADWDAVVGDRTVGAVLRLALTRPRGLEKIPGGIPEGAPSIAAFAGLVETAWKGARAEGRRLRLAMVGCGFNAPALLEDLSQAGADNFELTVLAERHAFEAYLGSHERYGVEIEFVQASPTDPQGLATALEAAAPDAVLVTPSPTSFNSRISDAEVTLSTLHVLHAAGADVPIVAELFRPESAARLPADPRLLPISTLRSVVVAVTLSIFDVRKSQELEREFSAGAADPPGS